MLAYWGPKQERSLMGSVVFAGEYLLLQMHSAQVQIACVLRELQKTCR